MRQKERIPKPVLIRSGTVLLEGDLSMPANPAGLVLFAHGSGSSRHSPRNQFVAEVIRNAGIGTLLFDLLTREEESIDIRTRELRFDIEFLTHRLIDATDWLIRETSDSPCRSGTSAQAPARLLP